MGRLVNYVAAGDQRALRQLYERTHRLVFSLIARVTKRREAADELTVEVFHDLWRDASTYDPAAGSVVAWIMNRARAKATERLELEQTRGADVLTPTTFLWGSIAKRIVTESGLLPVFTAPQTWTEPDWKEVAPGIACKLLAADEQRERVSMLVRLDPGTDYPPHTHAGVEELHLLHGELWIDRAQAPTRRLPSRGARYDGPARLERNRLHLRADDFVRRSLELTRLPRSRLSVRTLLAPAAGVRT